MSGGAVGGGGGADCGGADCGIGGGAEGGLALTALDTLRGIVYWMDASGPVSEETFRDGGRARPETSVMSSIDVGQTLIDVVERAPL